MNVHDALTFAARELSVAGIDEPVRESSTLLQYVLGCDRVFLIAHPEFELSPEQAERFRAVVGRRAAREPLNYITGRKEFSGLDFRVSPAVLIPRPETEMLVARSLEVLGELADPRFTEIGIGSGCIAISILVNLPGSTAVATDISPAAIAVAEKNAARHAVEGRIEIIESDLFDGLAGRTFDLIVSNPPYVHSVDIAGLQPEVRDHEPHTALTDGGDGLSIMERILNQAPQYLNSGGHLLVEIGAGQAAAVSDLAKSGSWTSFEIVDDLRGIPRMVFARHA